MGQGAVAEGPDLAAGIALKDCTRDGTMAARVGDTPVLLSHIDGDYFAIGATCTHYGGALAQGLIGKLDVRCPLHHACFDLKTGAVLRAPALDPVDRWRVEVEGERLFVRERLPPAPASGSLPPEVKQVVIVGGGAAGLACAIELRKLGYQGAITILSEDEDAPYDRPNLSKDYLAGTAQEEWMPLRGADWYDEQRIDLRLGTRVEAIDLDRREVSWGSGERLQFDRLLLATGAEPKRLDNEAFPDERVLTLRSFADARAIIEHAKAGSRASILGSSFIGLEAAAALRQRGVEVTVISPETTPFERVFGRELGELLQKLHQDHGVRFRLGSVAARFENGELLLANGDRVPADFVLAGIGVAPRTTLAEAAGLTVANGVWVDEHMETSSPGTYAAGDIAAYPDPLTGERVRIEHWTVAERQGQVAAANMLGERRRFDSAPFFWTEQHGLTVRYVGHAGSWDEATPGGPVSADECVLRYRRDSAHLASATINRDRTNLEDEVELEARMAATS
jgi:NADPH-dependent 2,4-dienoyl-CoA reductase/sulfur reductase-like enzyme/nitrite reductase/ring-hydroxylating ferredoxin subunit